MNLSATSTAKIAPGYLWPIAVISLGAIFTFAWVTVFVWLLLGFLMM